MSWTSDHGPELMSQHGWLVVKSGKVLLKGARLLDPEMDLDEKTDLLIDRGKIISIGKPDEEDLESCKVLNLRGKMVVPGLFDMHVHLREPGQENKETILTGATAAAAGGFTGVACMPNTTPALENVGVIRWVYDMAAGGPVDVHPVGAVTQGRSGSMLTEISDLYHAGVRVLSDDGNPVASAEIMRRALEYTKMHDMVISTHSEEMSLAQDGVMREGLVSTRLGMSPWPSIAESTMVVRDIMLAWFTGGRLHIGHISSKESVEAVRWAKSHGVNVTCEATPHHIALTDEACTSFDASATKMNPPLGTEEDRDAVIHGLMDGTIDAIATDHAPHTIEEKMVEFSIAPNGVIGLETALGVVAKELVEKKKLDWPDLVKKMSNHPRRILRLPEASIKIGAVADLTIIDPEASWRVDAEKFFSKGRNTPFNGWTLNAKPVGVINRGWTIIAPEERINWKE